MSPAGGVLAALVGYRAQPALTSVLAYAGFWLAMATLMARGKRQAAAR
jgi:high-affinity iron transporter